MAYYDIPTLSLIALWELWVLRGEWAFLGIAEVVEAVGVFELWVLRVLRILWDTVLNADIKINRTFFR